MDRASEFEWKLQAKELLCGALNRDRKEQEKLGLDIWLRTGIWQISMLCFSKEANFLFGKEARVL